MQHRGETEIIDEAVLIGDARENLKERGRVCIQFADKRNKEMFDEFKKKIWTLVPVANKEMILEKEFDMFEDEARKHAAELKPICPACRIKAWDRQEDIPENICKLVRVNPRAIPQQSSIQRVIDLDYKCDFGHGNTLLIEHPRKWRG